jgi:hypothetical protein
LWDWVCCWVVTLGVVTLVCAGGFEISFVASSSSRLRVMWLSNILSASTNLAFMVSATMTDEASIEAWILSSSLASTVSSNDASPVYVLPGVCFSWAWARRVLFYSWSAVTFSSRAFTLTEMSLSIMVPSRCLYSPV